ncbi:unnamed protein product [Vitrella brassicaformis CCMP3155]|uniref:Uncharacterized protein n=1 Tax=Vitrella brassicaformis (strain CCMP3155) TaxID=1169540 RepID=A0A0G4H390_VITBC|nr:unnamed protein product [Vitrella brassicaformis CCMP3155]|eukprot:CEM38183.1 unnamed protein product [Vitrella brassicaformis CCMP3155]
MGNGGPSRLRFSTTTALYGGTALREMEVERQRMAMVQAKREREGKELKPFLRLYGCATSLQDGAMYRESADTALKPCLYIEMQPLNDPTQPPDYVSLRELIWDMHYAGVAYD